MPPGDASPGGLTEPCNRYPRSEPLLRPAYGRAPRDSPDGVAHAAEPEPDFAGGSSRSRSQPGVAQCASLSTSIEAAPSALDVKRVGEVIVELISADNPE